MAISTMKWHKYVLDHQITFNPLKYCDFISNYSLFSGEKDKVLNEWNNKEFDVLSGPYKSINLVKNDYISLKIIGFEELDIYINE